MTIYETQHAEQGEDDPTDRLPVKVDRANAPVSRTEDGEDPPTSTIMPWNGPHGPVVTQNGYPGHVAPPHAVAALYGPIPLTPPLPLLKIRNFFTHLSESHLLPGLGVLTMAGLSGLAHSQPYHPLIGGSIIAAGVWGIRSGVHAHKIHGAGADVHFTKGLAGAGLGAILIGTDVTTGLSWWAALATGAGLWAAYGAWHQWRHHLLERRREFHVAAVAAGNTGPVLTAGPMPPGLPGAVQISDEEYRLRRAFGRLRADQVILSPVRRGKGDSWSVYADLVDTNLTAEKLMARADDLAAWIQARRVDVVRSKPGVAQLIVHDGDDPLEEAVPGRGPVATSILQAVSLGLFEDLDEILQVLAWNHVLIAGATDNGKSGVLNALIIATLACKDVVRIGIDCKAGAPEFGVYEPVMFHLAKTPEEGMRVLAGLEAVYEYRGRLLAEKGVPSETNEDGIPVRKWRPEYGPFIVALLDEMERLTSSVKGAAKRIQDLNALARYVGIIRVDATQTPSRDVFGGKTDARMNYQVRIGLRVTETTAINIIMGPGAQGQNWRLDRLDQQGKLMIQSRTHSRPRVGRSSWYEDAQIAGYVAQYRDQVTGLDEGSVAAFWEGYHAELTIEAADDEGGGPRGGKRAKPIEDAVPAGFAKPHLVVVPRYPNGDEVEERDVRLWQLLGEFGADGATAKQLAARAEARDHQYSSPAWVRGRLDYWREKQHVQFETDGRETRHWRADLRADQQRRDA